VITGCRQLAIDVQHLPGDLRSLRQENDGVDARRHDIDANSVPRALHRDDLGGRFDTA
jgi:hypothetical protein